MVILDRIITKVIHNAVQQLWDCFYGRTFSTNINRNIHLRSSSLQRIDSIFCNTIQIAVLPLHINIATVQLCQINNIFDQFRHPQRFCVNLFGKRLDILLFYQPGFNKLRIARYGMERCFQLM